MDEKSATFSAFIATLVLLSLFLSNARILNDEELIVLQTITLSSIDVNSLYSYQGTPFFEYGGKYYAPFSYFLPILAHPVMELLNFLNLFAFPDYFLFVFPLIILAAFAVSVGKRDIGGIILAFAVFNAILFHPIYRFTDWSPIYALKITNILLTSLTAAVFSAILVEFGDRRGDAVVTSLLLVFASPIAYWTLTAKSHALSLFLISASILFLFRYIRDSKTEFIAISYLLTGLTVWARPVDGLSIFLAITLFLLLRRREGVKFIPFAALGYLPCAVFGYAIFKLPLPVEIIGNLFSKTGYVSISFENPALIFVGINEKTLGILNYSPILASLIPSLRKFVLDAKKTGFSKRIGEIGNENAFMLLFFLTTVIVYYPFLHSGVVETGVRDYRFYLPIYIPLFYALSTSIPKRSGRFWTNLAVILPTLVVSSLFVSILLHRYVEYVPVIYLLISLPLALVFLRFPSMDEELRMEILPLALLPLTLIVSDCAAGYFSPYDVHFCLPALDRFTEFLIRLKSFNFNVL